MKDYMVIVEYLQGDAEVFFFRTFDDAAVYADSARDAGDYVEIYVRHACRINKNHITGFEYRRVN